MFYIYIAKDVVIGIWRSDVAEFGLFEIEGVYFEKKVGSSFEIYLCNYI